jgi:flagellar FliJ protein
MARARFQFRLERVRAMRERTEDEAREHLAGAMLQRDAATGRLAEASAQLQRARSTQHGVAGSGFSAHHMLAHQAFVERVEREEQAAEMEVSRQDAEVAARRHALQEAARERQVLEKLREKQSHAHRREADRVEANHIDELALGMHRRRRGVA